MSFLLGAFGTVALTKQIKDKASMVLGKAKHIATHVMPLPHGIIYAGQNHKHLREYNRIVPLEKDGGIIVGKIFDRSNNQPLTAQHTLVQQFPKDPSLLYQNAWGRFVGVLYHQTTHKLTLIRDPIGLSTLFYCEQPGGILFSTDVSLLYDVCDDKPSLDLSYFAEYIINNNQALPSTPFQNIKELLPGMAVTIDAQGKITQHCMWDITNLKGLRNIDEREIEEQLVATLKSSMKAWTHDSDGICLELSGS